MRIIDIEIQFDLFIIVMLENYKTNTRNFILA